MIRLNLPTEPYWIDLPDGVRVKVRVLTTPVYEAALNKGRRIAQEMVAEHAGIADAGGRVDGLGDLSDPDVVAGVSSFLFAQALAVAGVIEWEGVFGAEGADPAPVEPEAVKKLMRFHGMAEAFVVKYTRIQTALVTEGNGSGTAPHGISATVPDTAAAARPKTRPAAGAKKAKTASAAPISKTSRKRSKATKPGSS